MLKKTHKEKYIKRKINAKTLRFKHLIIRKKKNAKRKTFSFPIGIGISTWHLSDLAFKIYNFITMY